MSTYSHYKQQAANNPKDSNNKMHARWFLQPYRNARFGVITAPDWPASFCVGLAAAWSLAAAGIVGAESTHVAAVATPETCCQPLRSNSSHRIWRVSAAAARTDRRPRRLRRHRRAQRWRPDRPAAGASVCRSRPACRPVRRRRPLSEGGNNGWIYVNIIHSMVFK